jgi:hypothetical protein
VIRKDAAVVTATLKAFVPVLFAASFTCTVNDAVPAVVGVPLTCPVALSANPAGKAPALIDQLYGFVPPLACSVVEYAVPAVPPGSVVVVTVGGCAGAATTTLKAFVPVLFAESLTRTVIDTVPAVVGVPLITPVDETRLTPAGNVPALRLQVYGVVPPLACSVVEYPLPTVAPGSEPVITVGSEVSCRVAAALITLPTELLMATRKLSPLSDVAAGGVV